MSKYSIQNSLGLSIVVGSIVVALIWAGTLIASMLAGVSLMAGFAIFLMSLVIPATLLVGLAAEMWFKQGDGEPPSWLPKANRILIGSFLAVAFSSVGFALWMLVGHGLAAPKLMWSFVGDLLVVIFTIGCGFGARSLGVTFGKEFLPGVMSFLLFWNIALGAIFTADASLVAEAIHGNLVKAYTNTTCGPTKEQPLPVISDEAGMTRDGLLGPLYNAQGCEASRVDWSVQTDREQVRKYQAQQAAARPAEVQGALVDIGLVLVGGFFLLLVAGLAIKTLLAVATGETTVKSALGTIIGWLLVIWVVAVMLMGACQMLNLRPGLLLREQVGSVTGAPSSVFAPFTREAGENAEVGYLDVTTAVRLCSCGTTTFQVSTTSDWTAMPVYAASMYAMPPHGCGVEMTWTPDHLYGMWNRSLVDSPVLQVLRPGETLVCSDGSKVTY